MLFYNLSFVVVTFKLTICFKQIPTLLLLFHIKGREVWIGYEGYDENNRYVLIPEHFPPYVFIPYPMQPVPCMGYLDTVKLRVGHQLSEPPSFHLWDILDDQRYVSVSISYSHY